MKNAIIQTTMKVNGILLRCANCYKSDFIIGNGHKRGNQRYKCTNCGNDFDFAHRLLDENEISIRDAKIIEAVSHYYYGFPLRLISELMNCDTYSVQRWIKKYVDEHLKTTVNVSILKPYKALFDKVNAKCASLRRDIICYEDLKENGDEELDSEDEQIYKENKKKYSRLKKQIKITKFRIERNMRSGKLLDGVIWSK